MILIAVCQYVDMNCVFCDNIKTSVSNSRVTHQGSQVWRRRYCEKCGRTFTTRENVELGFLEVLKLNGSLEPFSRSKLTYAVMDACSHMPNQIDSTASLVETMERNLLRRLAKDSDIVSSSVVADVVATVLKRYDPLAHLKFIGHRAQAPTSKRELKSLIKDSN